MAKLNFIDRANILKNMWLRIKDAEYSTTLETVDGQQVVFFCESVESLTEGTETPEEDGVYVFPEMTVTVEDGKVVAIEKVEEAPEVENEEMTEEEIVEEAVAEVAEAVEEAPVEVAPVIEQVLEVVTEMVEKIEEQNIEIANLKKSVSNLGKFSKDTTDVKVEKKTKSTSNGRIFQMF